MSAELRQRLTASRVLAVVTLDRTEDAQPLAAALLRGGITAVELALRTPVALEALKVMRQAAPEILLGAGTVLTVEQAGAVQAAGADFALAPGLDVETVKHCASIGLPLVPGVATPSDIQAAVALDCRLLKFFPAEPFGGVKGLKTMAAPFVHLGIRFLPLGGISADTAAAYAAEPLVAAVGGSWIAPAKLIHDGAWEEISQRGADAVNRIESATP